METLFGIVGKDFVLTACDTAAARSILLYKTNEDKSRVLSDRSLMLYSGESGDTVQVCGNLFFFSFQRQKRKPFFSSPQFAEYIQKNIKLYELKNGIKLNPAATANYVRGELAASLRSRVRSFSFLFFSFLFTQTHLSSSSSSPVLFLCVCVCVCV